MQNLVVGDGSRAQILVVDDSEDLCAVIGELLSISGYEAATARDGGEALRLLRDGLHPKLILLDRVIPVVDGAQFLESAKELLQGISIVWMTGDQHVATHPAVVGVLRKPFDLEELLDVVRAYAGLAAAPPAAIPVV